MTDDEARDAILQFTAAIDRAVIDFAIAAKSWAVVAQSALCSAWAPFFERLRDDYPDAFTESGELRSDWIDVVSSRRRRQ